MEPCSYFVRLNAGFPEEAGFSCMISHTFTLTLPYGAIVDGVEESEDCKGLDVTCRVPQGKERHGAGVQEDRKLLLCRVRKSDSVGSEIMELSARDRYLGKLRLSQPGFSGALYSAYEVYREPQTYYGSRPPQPG